MVVSNIPDGSLQADPVLLENVKLTGEQIKLLCQYIEQGKIPPHNLAKQITRLVDAQETMIDAATPIVTVPAVKASGAKPAGEEQ